MQGNVPAPYAAHVQPTQSVPLAKESVNQQVGQISFNFVCACQNFEMLIGFLYFGSFHWSSHIY